MKFKTSLLTITFLMSILGFSLPLKANSLVIPPIIIADSPIPETYMNPQNANKIAIQIKEGEFHFHGILKRTSGNTFIASDNQVRVIYDKSTGRIVVINIRTGTEFYNYIFSTADEGAL